MRQFGKRGKSRYNHSMEKQGTAKKGVFFVLVAVFLIGAPLLILHSQGYRFSIVPPRAVQTGGIFVKALPKRATVTMDDTRTKTTDRFFGSALLDYVRPGTHTVTITKDGYRTWQKALRVRPSLVTEAEHIRLVRADIATSTISNRAAALSPNTERTAFLFTERDTKPDLSGTTTDNEQADTAIKLYETGNDIKSHLSDTDALAPGSTVQRLRWHPDGRRFLATIGAGERLRYFIVPAGSDTTPQALTFLPPDAMSVSFTGSASAALLIGLPEEQWIREDVPEYTLRTADIETETVTEEPVASNVVAHTADRGTVYWLDGSGMLHKRPTGGGAAQELLDTPVDITGGERRRRVNVHEGTIFYMQGNKLYRHENNALVALAEHVRSYAVSETGTVAVATDHEIHVHPARGTQQNEQATDAGTFITRLGEPTTSVHWLTPHYLLVATESELLVLETDTRDAPQRWRITQFGTAPEAVYTSDNHRVFFRAGGTFGVTGPVLPQ